MEMSEDDVEEQDIESGKEEDNDKVPFEKGRLPAEL